jgi:hypothetical protein
VVDLQAGQQHRSVKAGAATADGEDVDGLIVPAAEVEGRKRRSSASSLRVSSRAGITTLLAQVVQQGGDVGRVAHCRE